MKREYEKTYATMKVVAEHHMNEEKKEKKKKKKTMGNASTNPDLETLKAILVTTDENGNGDVFIPEETYLAKGTVNNKPVNNEHNMSEIFGHIFNSYLIDDEGKTVGSMFASASNETLWGSTSEAEDGHSHEWTIVVQTDGKFLGGWTDWTNGHRHFVTSSSVKEGKTAPSALGHEHELMIFEGGSFVSLPNSIRNKIVVTASASEEKLNIPDRFHIVADSYLYKAAFPEKVLDVKTEAATGNKFVSMECYFNDYDYKFGDKIVARNKETAFLDSHLKCRGGSGNFNGYSVGRVLRNIIFSGMGITDNPANKESVIIASTQVQEPQRFIENPEELNKIIEENRVINVESIIGEKTSMSKGSMKETGMSLEKKIADLEAALASKDVEIAKLQGAEVQAQIEELNSSVASLAQEKEKLSSALANKDGEIAKLKEEVSTLSGEVKASMEEIKEIEAENKSLKDKVLSARLEKRKADFEKFDFSDEDRVEILEEVKELDEEAYASYLAKANRIYKTKEESVAADTEEAKGEKAVASLDTAQKNPEEALFNGNDSAFEKSVASALEGVLVSGKKESK